MSEGNERGKIVPSTSNSLVVRNSGLVRRGLQDLAVSARKVRKRVLVADDQEAINELIVDLLSSAGYDVRATLHPSEVVALVEGFQPQVALIGLIAPEIDGVKLSQTLSTRFPALKIVLTGGEDVEEEIFRYLLDSGIACDTLELPCEREDIPDMMKTWMSGSDYVDRITQLRDAKHFRMGLRIGIQYFRESLGSFKHSIIFIELFQPSPSDMTRVIESSFLRSFGAVLARFARHGFAYRLEQKQFAMHLPNVGKYDACDLAKQLDTEVRSLLKTHRLADHYVPAIGIVSVPDDVRSVEQVEEAGNQLIANSKRNVFGGVEVYDVGQIEPLSSDG